MSHFGIRVSAIAETCGFPVKEWAHPEIDHLKIARRTPVDHLLGHLPDMGHRDQFRIHPVPDSAHRTE
jgi:hypothetical protein